MRARRIAPWAAKKTGRQEAGRDKNLPESLAVEIAPYVARWQLAVCCARGVTEQPLPTGPRARAIFPSAIGESRSPADKFRRRAQAAAAASVVKMRKAADQRLLAKAANSAQRLTPEAVRVRANRDQNASERHYCREVRLSVALAQSRLLGRQRPRTFACNIFT